MKEDVQAIVTFLSRAWKLITFNNETKIGFPIVAAFVLWALIQTVAGWGILPYSPIGINMQGSFQPPSLSHPFGTNYLGTDLLSQILAGTPNDAMVSFFVVVVAFLLGGFMGSVAAYVGGWVDEMLMRVTDIFFVIPSLILGMVIAVALGPSPVHVMIALAIIWWPPYARLARGETLRLSGVHFVESAKLSGLSTKRIIVRHIFPIAATTLVIYATLDIGTVVLTYSGLAYLGLAVRPPYPDWGDMVARYQEYIIRAPWLSLIPAAVITIVVMGFSLLGDGLRAALKRETGR